MTPPRPLMMSKSGGATVNEPATKEIVANARSMRKEVDSFLERWPEVSAASGPLPSISWRQLERQLADLATSPAKKQMAGPLVSATRKQAPFKPPEMVVREVLCIAAVLMDETFDPDGRERAMS
jgi:hypothetical protein